MATVGACSRIALRSCQARSSSRPTSDRPSTRAFSNSASAASPPRALQPGSRAGPRPARRAEPPSEATTTSRCSPCSRSRSAQASSLVDAVERQQHVEGRPLRPAGRAARRCAGAAGPARPGCGPPGRAAGPSARSRICQDIGSVRPLRPASSVSGAARQQGLPPLVDRAAAQAAQQIGGGVRLARDALVDQLEEAGQRRGQVGHGRGRRRGAAGTLGPGLLERRRGRPSWRRSAARAPPDRRWRADRCCCPPPASARGRPRPARGSRCESGAACPPRPAPCARGGACRA